MAWKGPSGDPAWLADLREAHPKIKFVESRRAPQPPGAEATGGSWLDLGRTKKRKRSQRLWADPEYVLKVKNGHARVNADLELRARRSQAAHQNWMDSDYRLAQIAAHRGKPWSPARRAALALEARKGRKHTPEARANMRQAALRREVAKRGAHSAILGTNRESAIWPASPPFSSAEAIYGEIVGMLRLMSGWERQQRERWRRRLQARLETATTVPGSATPAAACPCDHSCIQVDGGAPSGF